MDYTDGERNVRQRLEIFDKQNPQGLRSAVSQDYDNARERLGQVAQRQSVKKLNRWSMRALSVLALLFAAQIRYQPSRAQQLPASYNFDMARQEKKALDITGLEPEKIQLLWSGVDSKWNEERFTYNGQELTRQELDDILSKRFPEWDFLKDIANKFLELFDDGVRSIYQPVQEIIDNMTDLMGKAGKVIAYTGIGIFTLLASLFVYNSRKIGLGFSGSSAASTQLQSAEIPGIVRVENDQGIPRYLTMTEILKTIEDSNVPIVDSFFDTWNDFVFSKDNFAEFAQDFSKASSSASSVASLSSLSSLESEGLYGRELDGIARLTQIAVPYLLRFGGAVYGGLENVVSNFGDGMARIYGSCDQSSIVSCESQSVVSVVATTMQKNRIEIDRSKVPPALLSILDYGSASSSSSSQSSSGYDSELEFGGRKSRRRGRKVRKTKKARKAKKTKNAKKAKKVFVLKGGKKSKRSRR